MRGGGFRQITPSPASEALELSTTKVKYLNNIQTI